MQGIKRRVVYVTFYELIAIVICSVGFMLLSDAGLGMASALSAICSAVAVLWNVVFNHFFEWWESRQQVRGRSPARRLVHAICFEGGLVLLLVPLIAWWLDVSLLQAFLMDLGLVFFFFGYTFVFTWCFDRIFGLPASAAQGL